MADDKFDFDKKAASWDDNPQRVRLANDIGGAIVAEKILTPAMDVLEFGCGTGLLTLQLSPLVHGVTAMDGSRGMLDVIEAKIRDQGLKNIKTQLLDPSKGGIIEGAYDAVISSMTLHHVQEIGPLLAQFHRVMIPGAYLCLADLDPEEGKFHGENPTVFHEGLDRQMVEKILTRTGFYDVRDKTAATVEKTLPGGETATFTVFLITARKK
ncbi:MAG: class I SAM-dependent methyltransferase [Syntrophobacteraceae bacterium]|nr:class I SAM-dependent methyltransferase [Syntrophobacteraceae bacterium]